MIAHRMTTVRGCDVIYVLDHGKVVAKGGFEELLETSSEFRAMVEAGSVEHEEREPALSP